MEYNEKIKLVRQLVKENKFAEVENILTNIIQEAKIKDIEDENSTHYCFNKYIEILLFNHYYNSPKKNVIPEINYPEIYFYLSFINIKRGKLDTAIEYIKEGLKWNPVDVSLMFEEAAICRMQGNREMFYEKIKNIHRYIFLKPQLAKFFEYLGTYYLEKMQYDVANAAYTVSLYLKEKEGIKIHLNFIAKVENREVRLSTQEEIEILFKKYEIPLTYSNEMLNILQKEYERLSLSKPPFAAAKYLAPVLYDITHEEKYKQMMESMNSYSQIANANRESKLEYKNSIEKYEKDLKTAFDCYENGKFIDSIKILDNNINNLLIDDLTLKQDIYWKILSSSVFKAIFLNHFYNKKELTLKDFRLIIENEEVVNKNISEFCVNFRNNPDINFMRQIEDLQDKALKSAIAILRVNIEKIM